MPSDKPRKRPRASSTALESSAAVDDASAAAAAVDDGSDDAEDGRFELAGDGFSDDGAEYLLADDAGDDGVDEAPEGPDELSTEALLEYKAKADRTGCVRR